MSSTIVLSAFIHLLFADNIFLSTLPVTLIEFKKNYSNIGFIIDQLCIADFTVSKINFSVVIYYEDDPKRLLSPGADPCKTISQPLRACRGACSKMLRARNLFPSDPIFLNSSTAPAPPPPFSS